MSILIAAVMLGGCSSSDSDKPQDDPGTPTSPAITRDNHIELLKEVFQIYVGDSFNKPLLQLRQSVIDAYDYDGSIPSSYACVNGGTAQMDFRWNYEFDNCLVGETVIDGHLLQGIPDGPGIYGYTATSDGISIDHQPESLIQFSGTGRRWTNCSRTDYIHSWYTDNLNIEITGTERELLIENATTTFDSGVYTNFEQGAVASLNGDFTFSSEATGNQIVTVQVITEFQYNLNNSNAAAARTLLGDNGGYFPVGSLRLNTGTTVLNLNADNGLDDTVNITLTVDDETEVFTQPWSLWSEVLKFDVFMENALRSTCL